MRVLLINPPYQTLTSNLGVGHQVPLGLLCIGGPLLDAGHEVRLLDAEREHLRTDAIVTFVRDFAPDIIMTGHAGSTPSHPICLRMMAAIRRACPNVMIAYGGVYPTYHAHSILTKSSDVDVVIRGEGEATTLDLIAALDAGVTGRDPRLARVEGITWRQDGMVVTNPDRAPIRPLDDWRVGWELIEDWSRYTCFGLGRAAIVQFSRGCPHRCTYCGQHDFWVRWRRRDTTRFVDEIERLYRDHDVRFFTIADENPTTLQSVWREVLETIVERDLPVRFFATIRATDIVRDEAFLHLYRQAGIMYVLMGIESTDESVLEQVGKGSTARDDLRACRLLREHGIYSIIGHIVGLGHETWRGLRRASRVLAAYDGDYLNAMYVTPHDWTPFADDQHDRGVVQPDMRCWDYRHQVLDEPHLRPWQLFLGVKLMELHFHLRPRRLWRLLGRVSRERRRTAFWCQVHTGAVWLGEVVEFLFTRRARHPRPLRDHLGTAEPRPVRRRPQVTVSIDRGGRRDMPNPPGRSTCHSGHEVPGAGSHRQRPPSSTSMTSLRDR